MGAARAESDRVSGAGPGIGRRRAASASRDGWSMRVPSWSGCGRPSTCGRSSAPSARTRCIVPFASLRVTAQRLVRLLRVCHPERSEGADGKGFCYRHTTRSPAREQREPAPGPRRLLRRRGAHRQHHPRRHPPHPRRRGGPAAQPCALPRRLDPRRALRPARRHSRSPSPARCSPRPGGQYVIVRRGLGEYPGFVVGWSDWISTCGPIALGAMVFTEYLEPLVPAVGGRRVPGARRAGARLRAAALARDPDRRPLAADPERAQGGGVRTADRGLPRWPPLPPPRRSRRRRSPPGWRWSPLSCWRSRR